MLRQSCRQRCLLPLRISVGESIAPPPVAQKPATSLSLPKQIAVVPGGLPLQLSPKEEVALAMTSPLTVSGAAPLPLPIRTVTPPTSPGHPTEPGQFPPLGLPAEFTLSRFLKVTSPELKNSEARSSSQALAGGWTAECKGGNDDQQNSGGNTLRRHFRPP